MGAPDRLDDRLATAVGHVDVDEHDVGAALADELDGRADLVGVPDHLDGVPELGPHPGQEEMMIVDEEHAHLGVAWWARITAVLHDLLLSWA